MKVIERKHETDIEIIELAGRFDAYETEAVKIWFDRVTKGSSPQLIVNLKGVNFVDSAALATLVQGLKHSRQLQGDVYLCCFQDPVKVIFELSRLDRAFKFFETEAAAIEAYSMTDKMVDEADKLWT
jgi:anti-sigma B factor antagonist